MSTRLKIILVAGARPNFMKVAPLIRAIQRLNSLQNQTPTLDYRLVHTGQHYDEKMSKVFFQELGIPEPDTNLEVGSGSHATQTAKIMTRFETVLEAGKPDWVVVVGDINSTMACTLVSSKLGIKVAHVEAGLRSFDRTMPEEVNRIVTDALAELLLTPSPDANQNLLREGIPEERIRLVGNVMIDALVENLGKARQSGIGRELGLDLGTFAYATLHRPANVDRRESLSALICELQHLARTMPVVFPIHPRTRKMLSDFSIPCESSSALHVIDPVGYHDSLFLTEHARLVLTDSGGLQEESTYFQTPCLTLRPNTERPVTIRLGSNRLVSLESLRQEIEALLNRPAKIGQVPPLWDGHAAERVLREMLAF